MHALPRAVSSVNTRHHRVLSHMILMSENGFIPNSELEHSSQNRNQQCFRLVTFFPVFSRVMMIQAIENTKAPPSKMADSVILSQKQRYPQPLIYKEETKVIDSCYMKSTDCDETTKRNATEEMVEEGRISGHSNQPDEYTKMEATIFVEVDDVNRRDVHPTMKVTNDPNGISCSTTKRTKRSTPSSWWDTPFFSITNMIQTWESLIEASIIARERRKTRVFSFRKRILGSMEGDHRHALPLDQVPPPAKKYKTSKNSC